MPSLKLLVLGWALATAGIAMAESDDGRSSLAPTRRPARSRDRRGAQKRQSTATTETSRTTSYSTSSATSSSAASPANTTRPAASASLPNPPQVPLLQPPQPAPVPLDYMVSYALSDSCLLYLSTILRSPTFTSCLPFSLLLTTSTSYSTILQAATTSGNYTALNELLAYVADPQPSGAQCDTYLSGLLRDFDGKNNCGADVAAKKATAMLAQDGLGSYTVMRAAARLVNPDTGKYCYLDAVSASRPDDLYLWSLPAGIPLPPTSTPTCSKCSSLLLQQFATLSSRTATLNSTLVNSAISTVNTACGPSFVTSLASSPVSSAQVTIPTGMAVCLAAVLSITATIAAFLS